MLNFQKLDVYRCAIEFLVLATEIAATAPRGFSHLADQLRRSSSSAPLNIAEGYGRVSEPDATHFYTIARGSAMESAAVIDALNIAKPIEEAKYLRAMDLAERMVQMLTKMCL
jgi:four helix bundle protein